MPPTPTFFSFFFLLFFFLFYLFIYFILLSEARCRPLLALDGSAGPLCCFSSLREAISGSRLMMTRETVTDGAPDQIGKHSGFLGSKGAAGGRGPQDLRAKARPSTPFVCHQGAQ